MHHWVRFHTHTKSVLLAAHPSSTQQQPSIQWCVLSLRYWGKARLHREAHLACSLSPLIVTPEILTEAAVSLVPEEMAVALPGDKSLQTLPFTSEGTALLSEALALQSRMFPSDSQCVIVGDSSQLFSGSGCGLYFLLDWPAEFVKSQLK